MRICVYCSSSSRAPLPYVEATRTLGQLIALRGHELIYGGGNIGLMGELAQAVKAGGGRVVGVLPRRLAAHGLGFQEADELLIVETMAERKVAMEQRAEGFIALPGGFGTLEEVAEVLTLSQLEYLRAPIVLLNVGDFYAQLLAHFERLYQEELARPEFRQLYELATTPGQALAYIESYSPAELPRKWY